MHCLKALLKQARTSEIGLSDALEDPQVYRVEIMKLAVGWKLIWQVVTKETGRILEC